MSDLKVLVSDKLSEAGLKILRDTPGISVDVKTGMTPDELLAVIGDYDGLVIRSATKVTAEVIAAADRLKVVGRAGIGVDNVDTPAASAKGVVVMNTPGGNIVTTAEHAIAMMMAISRNIPQASASVKAGKWEKARFTGVELSGKTLGIIGIGRIGSIVANRAHGLNMNVIAHDPFISAEAAEKIGVELVSFDDLLARADFISIHCQLTDETRGLIGAEAFGKTKKGLRIVNCARGGVIDEAALAEAVKNGTVAGAALDVFETEPPADDSPLRDIEGITLTPHLGASTSEAQLNVAIDVAHQVADYLTKGIIQNAINVPSIAPEELPLLKPYLDLGEKLGSFLAQISQGAPKEIRITSYGELTERDERPVIQAVVKGALEAYVGKTVNMVNAPYLAESRGVVVNSGSSSEKVDFASLLQVVITTDHGSNMAEGTVFIGGQPRLVRLDDAMVEAKLRGDMLVFKNNDQPGVIGAIGTFMGTEGINIADFQLGRTEGGTRAMAIVNIDSAPTFEQIKAMHKIADVIDVRQAQL